MLGRLISFGCSFTYGYGLSDCYLENLQAGPDPSKQSYPGLLEKEFNIPSINKGKPGCSNLYITHEILNYQFQEGDFVIVQWTSFLRSTLFLKDRELLIGPWIKEDYCKQYYTLVDNEHLLIETTRNVHHIEMYLLSKRIPFIFITNTKLPPSDKVGWKINTPITSFQKPYLDLALDNLHPGPKTHNHVANHLSTLIKEKYDTKN
jgi:hypothetical protein